MASFSSSSSDDEVSQQPITLATGKKEYKKRIVKDDDSSDDEIVTPSKKPKKQRIAAASSDEDKPKKPKKQRIAAASSDEDKPKKKKQRLVAPHSSSDEDEDSPKKKGKKIVLAHKQARSNISIAGGERDMTMFTKWVNYLLDSHRFQSLPVDVKNYSYSLINSFLKDSTRSYDDRLKIFAKFVNTIYSNEKSYGIRSFGEMITEEGISNGLEYFISIQGDKMIGTLALMVKIFKSSPKLKFVSHKFSPSPAVQEKIRTMVSDAIPPEFKGLKIYTNFKITRNLDQPKFPHGQEQLDAFVLVDIVGLVIKKESINLDGYIRYYSIIENYNPRERFSVKAEESLNVDVEIVNFE